VTGRAERSARPGRPLLAPQPIAYTHRVVWETIFMLLVLKIPVAYLCVVVWWAIRSVPGPEEPAALVPASVEPRPLTPASGRPRRASAWRRGGPTRRPGPRTAQRSGVSR
jgi:hypothetical protein